MPSSWKAIYPWIQSALMTCQSPEDFCQQAIAQVAVSYDAEGWLWIGLDTPEAVQVYSSHQDAASPVPSYDFSEIFEDFPPLKSIQLSNGDLVIPLAHPVESTSHKPGQALHLLVIQLRRQRITASQNNEPPSVLLTANQAQSAIYGWSADELDSLEVVSSQIGLAYELLDARYQVSLFRQRIALLSRTAYLLNSNLPLETQLTQLLQDLGSSIGSDRGFVLRRRDQIIGSLATWNMHAVIETFASDSEQQEKLLWQDVIELFEEGGSSHLDLSASDMQLPTSGLQDWLSAQGCAAGVLLPMHVRGQFLGIVGLLSAAPRNSHSIDELQILRQATEQLAIALASLYYPVEPLSELWRQPHMQYDTLTGCETRAVLEQTLSQMPIQTELAATETSVILCDLDYFKHVNDAYNHTVGDQVLRTVAYRIRDQLRHGTKLYRYGGEEFAILLGDTPKVAAIRVAERLRWAIGEPPIKTSAGDISITASFGVAQHIPADDEDTWTVFQRAEAAVAEAKRRGRNQVVGQ